MNTLPFLIARRYLWGSRTDTSISTMVLICFIGIFIGTFALALVASIMNGFEKATHEKLQGIHAQIIMQSPNNEPLNGTKIQEVLRTEFSGIKSISPASFKQVILQKPGSQTISNAVIIKFIDPEKEQTTSSIGSKITQTLSTNKTLASLVHDNNIVIGEKLAQSLDLKPGNAVTLLYIPEQTMQRNKLKLEQYDAIVAGLFATGIEEFDTNLILGSFALMQTIFGDQEITQFNLKLHKNTHEKDTIHALQKRFNLDVFSWKELYPALVAALQLEKYVMFFILALIALVASMNIVSLIFMQIIQKRADIAIYQAMGMHKSTITRLFMGMGIFLCACAALAGLLAAYLVGIILEQYPFIKLPDTYYVSYLPIQMEWYIFVLIFILILIMSIIATAIPCRNIRSINTAHILRFEG
jgi:lipoprotein-releasing system permease protein